MVTVGPSRVHKIMSTGNVHPKKQRKQTFTRDTGEMNTRQAAFGFSPAATQRRRWSRSIVQADRRAQRACGRVWLATKVDRAARPWTRAAAQCPEEPQPPPMGSPGSVACGECAWEAGAHGISTTNTKKPLFLGE